MGGRGSAAPWPVQWLPVRPPPAGDLPYTVISGAEQRGGASYPFLDALGRTWHLVSLPLEEAEQLEVERQHTLGMAEPTLRWISDNALKELYVDGMGTDKFLAHSGLRLSLAKGAAVLSKRLARVMRPYSHANFLPADAVQVAYLQQSAEEKKVWDGAGLISRRMLARLALPEGLDEAKRRKLTRDLAHAQRVEFTLLTAQGQDKGHALVVDDLRDAAGNPVDFLLPEDTKGEVQLTDGRTFVGVNVVHGQARLRLDVQSLINLRPFFETPTLIQRLDEQAALFAEGIRRGDVGTVMQRIDQSETVEDLQSWHLREFLACGGQPLWFASHVRALFSQHLKGLRSRTGDKLRLPVGGARLYVLPVGVGTRAGLGLEVPRDHIHLDPDRATAWVNDADWLELADSPPDETGRGQGLAAVWGGADNDDALWLFPFTDTLDNEPKVLAWRSPNQPGEGAVLRPTADGAVPGWVTSEGEVRFPHADSRLLPQRIDQRTVAYQGLVAAGEGTGLGQGAAYSVGTMREAAGRLRENAGGLELYCNTLMVHQAMQGDLPPEPPAPLEEVVDSKKTGASLRAVKDWCLVDTRERLDRGERLPKRLLGRLTYEREPYDPVPPPLPAREQEGHWLDELDGALAGHVRRVERDRDALLAEIELPARLWDAAFDDPEAIEIGAKFNQIYSATVKRLRRARAPKEAELVGQAVEAAQAEWVGMDEAEQVHTLRQFLFAERWRARARRRSSGEMTAADYAEVLAEVDGQLARWSPAQQAAALLDRLIRQARWHIQREGEQGLTEADHDVLRERMERFLARWPAWRHSAILRGAMVSVHLSPRRRNGADAGGVWLSGKKQADGTRGPGIAQRSIQALREIGLLDEVDTDPAGGVIVYPAAAVPEPTYQTVGIRLGRGKASLPEAQDRATELAEQHIMVAQEAGSLVVYSETGVRLGRLSQDSRERVHAGQTMWVQRAWVKGEQVRLAVQGTRREYP